MSHEVNTQIWESLYEAVDELSLLPEHESARSIFTDMVHSLERGGHIEDAVRLVDELKSAPGSVLWSILRLEGVV